MISMLVFPSSVNGGYRKPTKPSAGAMKTRSSSERWPDLRSWTVFRCSFRAGLGMGAAVLDQARDHELQHGKSEPLVLKIELLGVAFAQLIDLAVGPADHRRRALSIRREHADLSDQRSRAKASTQLGHIQRALDDIIKPVSDVILPHERFARGELSDAHERQEAGDRKRARLRGPHVADEAPHLYQPDRVDREQNGMQNKHRVDVGRGTVKAEQHVAAERHDTKRDHGAHAERREDRD